MTKSLTLSLACCSLVIGFYSSSLGQQGHLRSSVGAGEEKNGREQDGLRGPVRRIRVETSRMLVKGGDFIEGPRMVRGTATYDPTGKKIDAVDFPAEGTSVSGNERYSYDDKGNIVGMVVVGGDGSILSREAYEYEFDQVGNWIRMGTSIAVYENGKVTYEPMEVTYRGISYYYNQAIEKLSVAAKSKGTKPASSPLAGSTSYLKTTAKPIESRPALSERATEEVKDLSAKASVSLTPTHDGKKLSVKASVPVAPTSSQSNELPLDDPGANEVNSTADATSRPGDVKVAEDVPNPPKDLPQPEYSETSLVARAVSAEAMTSQYNVGVSFYKAGRYEEAVRVLQKSIEADPNHVNAYLTLAMSYSALDKHKEAVLGYKKVAQIEPSALDASAFYMLGESLLALDKNSDAISAFKRALHIRRAEAVGLESNTIQSFPSFEQLNQAMGVAYLKSQRLGDSIKAFKQVVTINPANADAQYALSVAYIANGDRGAAVNQRKILSRLNSSMAEKVAAALAAPTVRIGCRNIACR